MAVADFPKVSVSTEESAMLETVFLAAAVANQLLAVSEQFPQSTDFLTGNVTGRNDVKLKKIGNPGRVFIICFLSFDSADIFGIGNNGMAGIFQDIKNRNPVFAGGFHTDLCAVMAKEPIFQSFEVGIKHGEPLFDIRSNAAVICNGDSCDHKFFVDVDAVADKVFDRQHT